MAKITLDDLPGRSIAVHRGKRYGQAFDVGETFSGVPLEAAFDAVEALRPLVPPGTTMAQFALRWILMADAVTVVIRPPNLN